MRDAHLYSFSLARERMSMLSDPLSVTYNSVAKSLPVSSGLWPTNPRELGKRMYKTADGEFTVATRQLAHRNGDKTAEISLSRTVGDTDVNTVAQGLFSNSVTLSFTTNSFGVGTSVDIPLLRSALLALVDSTLQGRLIVGEH
jgi:hypothetical protein